MCVCAVQVIFMLQFFSSVDDETWSFTVAKIAANCLAYTNSCVNPILYAFLSENFRKAFFRLVACCVDGDNGAGGFNALRKMELENTNVSVGRRISAQAATAAAGRKTRQYDDGEMAGAMTQQTDL